MRYIWATRGWDWGFRFPHDGGFPDPLIDYDPVFARLGYEPEGWVRVDGKVGLRFLDPLGRQDQSGRIIPHEFVVYPPEADEISSVESGRELVWPEVAGVYEQLWGGPNNLATT